jgi:hypothetical protein
MVPIGASAQFNESREFSRRFKVEPDTKVEISNKYGNVEINTWPKDSVVFEIKIKVEEKTLSKLEKSMAGIDFDFTNSPHFLIARTLVNKTSSTLEKELLKFKETILQTEGNVDINYKVWLPEKSSLTLDNKFGNIFISDYPGNCAISLANGNLKAHEFSGKTEINLSFADATINKINSGQLNTNYSEVDIDEAKQLLIISKQSTFEISEVSDLDINARRDKYRIRMVDKVNAGGSFTNFRISELGERIRYRADYGDLVIESINAEFSNIFVETMSANINLNFDPAANFGFDITETKTDLDLCTEMEVADKNVMDEKLKKNKLTGRFGKKANPEKKVVIIATLGTIGIASE